jgi:hypothetical protein
MKAIATLVAVAFAALASTAGYSCDENCLKEAAEKEHKVEFPGYVNWAYCDEIRMDFMTSAVRSLENYQSNHFDTRYKGGMRNIVNFIEQREEWLKECDQYLAYTGKGRIFDNEETTQKIFGAMDRVQKELNDLIQGVVYATNPGSTPTNVARTRFEELFQVVDDHKTLMHLKGKYVFR